MSKSFSGGHEPRILSYIEKEFQPEDPVLREIRERSERNGLPPIQVGSMDSLHLEIITRACGAKKAVEIGTLGGYSGVTIARAMGGAGRLFTFEADSKHAQVARESFQKAGVADRVEILVGPAISHLPKIGQQGPFDLVFIDADKVGYPSYLAWAAENLRVGGVLLADNTLGFGMIADERIDDPEDREAVEALRRFNHEAAQGGRFRATMLPTGEGLTFAVKIR